MKKTLCIIAILLFFSMISCVGFTSTNNLDEINTSSGDYEENDISVIPINYSFESVIQYSDDVFIGRLIGVNVGSNLSDNIPDTSVFNALRVSSYVEYEFEIISTLFSSYESRNPETIKVYLHDYGVISEELGYNPMYDCTFYEGYEYLLPVTITDKTYFLHDVFHIPGDMVLALDQSISQYSSLMGIHSIIIENGTDLVKEVNKDSVISYVEKLVLQKNSRESYTFETDISKIVNFSDNIWKVQVMELIQTRHNEVVFGETYTVKILEVLKGTDRATISEIKIDFIGGTVKPGDVVYVSLDSGGTRYGQSGQYFNLTSRVKFDYEDISQIRSLLGK
ncbi:MAG: hypothetical protein KJ971_01805 [Firmicutes bacterium]|nr:hypothetical protein [Bacillota bacterium]